MIRLSRIGILIFYPSRIPDPGVIKAQDPGIALFESLKGTNCMMLTLESYHIFNRLYLMLW